MKGKNLKFIFYLLVTYTLLAFAWWGYLLWQKNEEAYHAVIELELMIFEENTGAGKAAFFETENFQELSMKHRRQQFMIVGEGIVLFILLLLGIWRLKTTLYKEVELARRQNNFLLSVTHELKSPLASVKLGLQTLKKHYAENEKTERIMYGCLEETDRLDALINNILLTARLDNEAYKPEKEVVMLKPLLENIAKNLKNQYKNSHRIELQVEDNLKLETDSQIVKSVFVNLLENAHKYAPAGTSIKIRTKSDNSSLHVFVIDEGPGIPGNEKSKIFEKFYRSGNEEVRKTKGTGLGLYIVKNLLKLIGADISIESENGKGTLFKVRFPKTLN